MKLLLILSSVCLLLTGCAFKNKTISLSPSALSYSTTKTMKIPVAIATEDLRSNPDVGYVKNILGMKIARILLNEPLKDILYQSLAEALKAQGYLITEKTANTLHLNLAVHECYTKYDERVFRKKAIADLDLVVTTLNSHNQAIFTKKIHTQGKTSSFLWLSTKTVKKAVDQALDKALLILLEQDLFKEIQPL
jgi:uncharacterized lipoprotein YajG